MKLKAMAASISELVATVGQSSAFITAMAHAWAAFGVLAICAHWGLTLWASVPAALLLVAWKEFYFDLRHETAPQQTWIDSAQDAIEYAAGIALAVFIYH